MSITRIGLGVLILILAFIGFAVARILALVQPQR
jgi:hypothetical protein